MTEIKEVKVANVGPVDEAVALIDEGLGGLTDRKLVSAAEVTDLLLDVRMLLNQSS